MASFDRLMRRGIAVIPVRLSYLWNRNLLIGEFHDCPCLVLFQDKETAESVGGTKGDLQQIKTGKKGRIRIPVCFSKFSNFTGEVTFINIGNRLEIWCKEEWREWNKIHEKEYDNTIIKILSPNNKNA